MAHCLNLWVKFDLKRVFAYEQPLVQGTFKEVVGLAFSENEKLFYDKFASGNMLDYLTLCAFAKESTDKRFPPIIFKPVKRDNARMSNVFNEPVSGKIEFDKNLLIPAMVTYNKPDVRLSKTGIDYSQDMEVHIPMLSLLENDYTPWGGDVLLYLGRMFGIKHTYVSPECIYAEFGLPTFLSCSCSYLRYGDADPGPRLSPLTSNSKVDPATPNLPSGFVHYNI